MSITKTPLHISASLGHGEVVRTLLAAKAQVSHAVDGGPPELTDAVDGCHVEVVKLLVQGKAEIFTGEPRRRGVDYIFEALWGRFGPAEAAKEGLRASKRGEIH